MGDYLGNSRHDLSLNKLATKPARTQSRGLRIALIAGAALALGVTGLIAQAVSQDGNSPFAPLLENANSTFTTVGGKVGPSTASVEEAGEMRAQPMAEGDADIRYGPAIVEPRLQRQQSLTRKNAASKDYAKDGWRGAKTETAPKEDRRYAEKTTAPEKTSYSRDKGDYFAPSKKEAPKSSLPPGEEKSKEDPAPKFDEPKSKESPVNIQEPIETNRKIIRTGEMDFEVDSYDVAVVNITKNLVQIKGAFISDSKSGQLKNGKLHGYVVVRMPPQFLDQFILDLRRDLTKNGELKTQRINSQDVTKQYTDIESGLKAARTMEERFLQIIKTGKGEIKDLIAAENALGEWRTKIEKMEGELRYYANQVGLSTLTISLSERELQTPFALVATETVTLRIEAEDVKKAHAAAVKAVLDAKGRVLRSEVKQHAAGQLEAILHADLPPATKDSFDALVQKLGIVSQQESHSQSEARGGVGRPLEGVKPKETDTHFEVTFNNLVNIAPRKSTTLQVATTDVVAGYHKLHEAIAKVKGQVRNTNLNETDKKNVSATIDFTVPATEKDLIDKAIGDVGPILTRHNIQAAVTELASERKVGFHLTLVSVVNLQAREKVQLKIEVKNVDDANKQLKDLIAAAKARITDARTQSRPNGEVAAILAFDVPLAAKDALVRQIKDTGKLIGQEEERFPTAPDNELAVAHIHVIIAGTNPLVPSDEGFGSYLRSSATLSFRIFATSVMLILIGISIVLPWGLLVWGGYKLYTRMSGPAPALAAVTVQPMEGATPAPKG